MRKKLLLFLFEFGFLFKFQFFGTMSVSEVFLLFIGIPLMSSLKPLKDSNLSLLSFLYLLLISVQLLASAFHPNNSVGNDMKGIAVSVVGFLHVLFLYRNCRGDLRLLGYAFAGYSAYFIAKWVLNERPIDPESVQLVFLKFYFVPALGAGLMLWLLYSIKSSRVKSIAYIFLGALFITLGTRSAGSFFFLPGVFSLLIAKYNGLRNYKLFVPLTMVIGYAFYCFYTYLVLSGDITSGNTFQTLKLVNPYNPVNLLITGRTEIFAQWVAFTQKPLWGWGSWADDPNMYFHRLMLVFRDVDNGVPYDRDSYIPNHSVVVGAGMTHGVFALAIMFSIFVLIMKRAFTALYNKTPFVLPLLFVSVDFFWNMWFSPPSAFRYNIPFDIVLILLIFVWSEKKML